MNHKLEITPEQETRLVQWYWQFEGVDVSDVDPDKQEQFRRHMKQKLSQRQNSPTLDSTESESSTTNGNGTWRGPTSSTIARMMVVIASFALLYASATWVRSTRAANAQAVRVDNFARTTVDFVHEIYEENSIRTAYLLDKVDAAVPVGASIDASNDERKMMAIRWAIRSLLASRTGDRQFDLSKIHSARSFAIESSPSQHSVVDFLFYLTAGKAGLEGFDTTALLGYPKGEHKPLPEDSKLFVIECLKNANDILERHVKPNLSEDEYHILKAGLLTDLMRAVRRYGRQPYSDRLVICFDYFAQANEQLGMIQSKDAAYTLAKARLLNNRILLDFNQKRFEGPINNEDVRNYKRQIETELDDLSLIEPEEFGASANAIKFEIALCYLNFADYLSQPREYFDDYDPSEFEPVARQMRSLASSMLSEIPRSSRTARCVENLLLARVRSLVPLIKANEGFESYPLSVIQEAKSIDDWVGGVLETEIGQFSMLHRICIATVLKDRYTVQQLLKKYATELRATNLTIVKWHVKHIEYLESIADDRD
ncbi:MAG: hypothetical protein AAFN77_19085 [Planctomycetota bacterium]